MATEILPIDAKGLADLGISVYNTVAGLLKRVGVPEWFIPYVAGWAACFVLIFASLFAIFANGVTGVGAFFAVKFMELIGRVKKTNASDFNNVIAASANELLGTSITGSQLTGGSGGTSMEQSKPLGDALLKAFESSLFPVGGEIKPGDGADNAKKFAGFAINFAMNQGFLSILTESCSLGVLKEFHELPDALKSALGLGRLQRAALAPLVRNTISQPYDLYLKYLLRPDRLGEGQIVHALKSGKLDDTTARQMLAEKGYRDSDIELLITELSEKIAATELFTLVRYGDLTLDQAITKLTDSGMDADHAKLLFKALSEAKADTQVGGTLSDLEAAYTDGFIDQGQFNAILAKLPLSDDEEQMYRLKVGSHQERPRKRISFAQLKTGVIDGIVDFTYVDTWLAGEGYSPDDQLVLSYEILQALKTAEDKAKAHAHVTTKAHKVGKTIPPA